jgi:hypothetical protein
VLLNAANETESERWHGFHWLSHCIRFTVFDYCRSLGIEDLEKGVLLERCKHNPTACRNTSDIEDNNNGEMPTTHWHKILITEVQWAGSNFIKALRLV